MALAARQEVDFTVLTAQSGGRNRELYELEPFKEGETAGVGARPGQKRDRRIPFVCLGERQEENFLKLVLKLPSLGLKQRGNLCTMVTS